MDLAKSLRSNPSEPERRMWALLWPFRQQGWHFRRQVRLDRYVADFACLHAKLVIEVDGDTHGTAEAERHDAERTEYLNSRGLQVLRFGNADVMANPDGVFAEIASILRVVQGAKNTPTPVPSPQGGGRICATTTPEEPGR